MLFNSQALILGLLPLALAGWYLAPNIFRALSKAAPKQVQAFTGLPVAASVYGRDQAGDTYSDMLFVGGGQAGLLVPEEVAVLASDDDSLLCDACLPPLSGIASSSVHAG